MTGNGDDVILYSIRGNWLTLVYLENGG